MVNPALISDNVGTNPIIISKRHAQHSHLTMWEHIPQPCQKFPALTSIQPMIGKAQHLHLAMQGTNPPCQNALHLHLTTNVRKAQNLYSTMQWINPSCWKGSALTSEKQCQKGSALTSDNQFQKGSALTFDHARNQSSMPKGSALTSDNQCQKGSALTSDHVGTNPTVTSECPSVPDWAFLVTDKVPPFS